ncbi:sensor histidine kinase [Nostoc sp. KVJ3]|uniref:sensor histidine kinase n=1 Tax=Nostoc sp. KVJ3 TaxID=457945 RepID=UPI00223807E0|nr:sensor histidine kinase [Nostoc sp. KVJ3]
MQIRQKLIIGFLGISLLTGVVGVVAIYQQVEAARQMAILEAENVAETIAAIANQEVEVDKITPPHTAQLQKMVVALHKFKKRDIEIIDKDLKILADVHPQNIGKVFREDEHGEIAQTLKDKLTRFFVEKSQDYQQGIRQIVVPVEIESGETVAVVVLEYTPLYEEMLDQIKPTIYIITASTISCIFFALVLGILISQNISAPLKAVTLIAQEATQQANFDLQAPIMTSDETGQLATSLNQLIRRVKELLTEKEQQTEVLQQANEQLQTTQKQMIAQEKLASLGSLTAGIAHEIRNPLNFINNFAQLSVDLTQELSEELTGQWERLDVDAAENIAEIMSILQTNVSKIEHHGKRAEKIVSNMLLHARSGESKRESTKLNELLEETLNLAYHGMRAKDTSFNITFDKNYDDTISQIEIVPEDINRAFLNIISNACYAMQKKQQEIGSEFSPVIQVRSKNLGDAVEIRIRDNGSGISPEVCDRIFEHFFTTKPTGEGTGLGLSLTYEIIVQQHRGKLDVQSEVGSYAEFIITLPKSQS